MAFGFRIEALKKISQEDFRVLFQLFGEEGLNYIEKNNKLPPEATTRLNAREIASLQTILAKIPSKEDAINSFLAETKDEANLNTEQLRRRQEAFKELEKPEGKTQNSYIGALEEFIKRKFGEFGLNKFVEGNKSRQIAEKVSSIQITGRSLLEATKSVNPEMGTGESVQQTFTSIQDDYAKEFQERIAKKEFDEKRIPSVTFSEDIKRIGEIITGREMETKKEGELQKFLAETPAELKTERNKFLSNLEESGRKYLQERYTPQIALELAQRGLLETAPEFTSLLARETGKVQSGIESAIIELENKDNQFLADAAYALKQQKLKNSEQEFRQAIATERSQARIKQQRLFTEMETAKEEEFDLELLKRQQERFLKTGVQEIQIGAAERSARLREALIAQTFSDIGSTATAAIIPKILPPEKTG